jgi:Ku protein
MLDKDQFIEVSKEELEEIALESARTIEIDEFVDKSDIDPRYLIRPYYIRPDGKVGHDAFAVIRETIREMNKVAIGRMVLTNREHIIALEPMDKGLVGTRLRVEAARLMLEEGRHTVEIVAYEIGFGDRERMRRAFLRNFGLPPQAVRRTAQL